MLHCGWRGLAGGDRRRRRRRAARARRGRAGRRRDRPGCRRLLLRGRRGGPRRVRRSYGDGRPRRAASSTSRPSRGASSRPPASPRCTTSGMCTLCARPGALLLAPPRRRRDRPAGGGRVAELIDGLDPRARAREPRGGPRRDRPPPTLGSRPRTRSRSSPRRSTSRPGSWGCSPRPGIDARRREPRPGPRGQGASAGAPRFTWDFIGHLQSRKVKHDPAARPAHPLGRDATRCSSSSSRHGTPGHRGARRGQPGRRGRPRAAWRRPSSTPSSSAARCASAAS